MRELRIVFMGTPDFAVATLEKIVSSSHNIVGVITAPDKPAGRGRKLSSSAVKKFALARELTVLQPARLRDPEFLENLSSLKANLFVVVAFRMLPEVVWQLPEYGTFNLHASLLPQYRGAAPINWAVINGEKETGVTTFYINEKIDTGEIILQEKTSISPAETAGDVHDRLMELGAELVMKTIDLIASDNVNTQIQPEAPDLKSAPKIQKASCRIDWNSSAKDICNHIRGLSPYPGAWSRMHNGDEVTDIKIFKANFEIAEQSLSNGKILATRKELKIAVRGGFIFLKEIQLAGKRKMSIQEALNGLKIGMDAKLS
ncbi:MAG: methionyl-tRNA formyltransferase [Flavobacteriaceae bacterium]